MTTTITPRLFLGDTLDVPHVVSNAPASMASHIKAGSTVLTQDPRMAHAALILLGVEQGDAQTMVQRAVSGSQNMESPVLSE